MIELFIYVIMLVFFIAVISKNLMRRKQKIPVGERISASSAGHDPLNDHPSLNQVSATGMDRRGGEGPNHILIVDDQSAIRMQLVEVFAAAGFIVSEAANGQEAIEKYQEQPTDFILLDLSMPGMDGVEALRVIHSMNQEVKAIMISAYGDPDKIAEARKLGVERIFSKPFDIDKLRDYVVKQLDA